MTLEEVCKKYGVAESSMTSAFPRTQKAIMKKYNVRIIKNGRGKTATYEEEVLCDNRALTMYEETKDEMIIDNVSFNLVNLDFCCFIAIIMTPMLVFRGSFSDFCKYMEIKDTKENIQAVKGALASLEERGFISYNLDRTDKTYFVAALYRKVEEEMKIGIDMIRTCKEIADKHNKRSWVPLLKTWLGIQLASDEQPFTVERLQEITGLSAYQIKESKRLLEQNDLFKTSRAYIAYNKCVGSKVELNAFYHKT